MVRATRLWATAGDGAMGAMKVGGDEALGNEERTEGTETEAEEEAAGRTGVRKENCDAVDGTIPDGDRLEPTGAAAPA